MSIFNDPTASSQAKGNVRIPESMLTMYKQLTEQIYTYHPPYHPSTLLKTYTPDQVIGFFDEMGLAGMPAGWLEKAKFIIKHKPDRVPEAVEALKKAHLEGNAVCSIQAGHLLADMYLGAQGVPKDEQKAIEFLKKCADLKDTAALRRLVGIYLAKKTEVDTSIAMNFLLQGVALKDPDAFLRLGLIYYYGAEGVLPDPKMARFFLEKGSADRPSVYRAPPNTTSSVFYEAMDALYCLHVASPANGGKSSREWAQSPKALLHRLRLHYASGEDKKDLEGTILSCSKYEYLELFGDSTKHFTDKEKGVLYRDIGRITYRENRLHKNRENRFRNNSGNLKGDDVDQSVKAWVKGAKLGDAECLYYLGLYMQFCKKPDEAKEYWQQAADKGSQLALGALDFTKKVPLREKDGTLEEAKASTSLVLKDRETQDAIAATKEWRKHQFTWIQKAKGLIAKIAIIGAYTLLVSGIVAGMVALTIFFPYVMVPILIVAAVGGLVGGSCYLAGITLNASRPIFSTRGLFPS